MNLYVVTDNSRWAHVCDVTASIITTRRAMRVVVSLWLMVVAAEADFSMAHMITYRLP